MAHNLRYHIFVLIIVLVFNSLYSSYALASLINSPDPMYSSSSASIASSTVQGLHPYSCHPSDRDALLDIAASSSNSTKMFSGKHLQWRHQQDCCHWAGVTCGASFISTSNNSSANPKLYSRVVGLALAGDSTATSSGMLLPLAICRLSALASLDLSWNILIGPIPICFSHNLTSLQTLILTANSLSGSLFPIANLSLLTHLDLRNNEFSLVTSIILSGNLTYLDLSLNHLSGSLSALKFHTPSSLKHLNLSDNSLSGSDLSFLKGLSAYNLRHLDLSDNQLDLHISLIPAAFSTYTPLLESLDLSGNEQITGDIRVLEHLQHLEKLTLDRMPFIPTHGALESLLCKLGSLQVLSVIGVLFLDIGDVTHMRAVSTGPAQLDNKLPCEKPASLNLTSLDLSERGYTGPFPTWIGQFARLQSLTLENNQFEGSIPQEWQALTQLTYLSLSGDWPATPAVSLSPEAQSWLFRLPLEVLSLKSMGLISEDFPCNSAGFTLLNHTLRSLSLAENHISPGSNSLLHCMQHHNFSLLHTLDLSENPLASPLQPHMFPMTIVKNLILSYCQLFGSLPNMGTLPRASGFVLDHNNLTGSIPSDIGSAPIYYLDLSYNKLTGTIPSSVWNLTGSTREIFLDNNQLHGALDPSAGLKAHIVSIANNFLTKAPFYNVSSLNYLDLSSNQLEGDLDNLVLGDYSVMKFLCFLHLDNNQLTASGSMISSLAIWNQTTKRNWLSLNNNNLHGELVLHDQAITIAGVSIANNHLSKVCFHNVSYLTFLDLSNNHLGGTLESMLGDYSMMKNLAVLLLHSNQLSGSIPSLLGPSSPSLITINLSNNKLTGAIPPSLQHLQALRSKIVNFYTPEYGYVIKYTLEGAKNVKLNMTLKSARRGLLDLSSNQLSGVVPDGLGTLVGLNDVNLSRNQLSGLIPNSLSRLSCLESLDLSFNNLEGVIPSEFSKLTSLEVFNVSFNPKLSGKIPEGPQLETASSFQGDPKLCGLAISKKCGEQQLMIGALTPTGDAPNTLQTSSFEKRFASFIKWIEEWVAIPGIILGHVVGMAITIWALKRVHFFE